VSTIKNVNNVVKGKEKAIILFTRGGNTTLNHIGSSSTGDWKVHEDREFDTVIIYHRDDAKKVNTVFKGTYTNRTPSIEGRVMINMDNVTNVGTTESNWTEFSGNGNNPIAYSDKE